MNFPKNPLPRLPLSEWEPSKLKLHLMAQIIGKVKLKMMPRKNHWWNITLQVNSKGLTSGPIPHQNSLETFEMQLNLIKERLEISSSTGEQVTFKIDAGVSVADFYKGLFDTLKQMQIEVEIKDQPYDLPIKKSFSELKEIDQYDSLAITKYFQIMRWTHNVFTQFSGRFYGKCCPVHLYWHSFDLTVTRFSGKKAAPMPEEASLSNKDAYSHENISFGFWPGDLNLPEPAYYSYTYPAPDGIDQQKLSPDKAQWIEQNGSPMALLKYHDLLTHNDPVKSLLAFLESAYQAGAQLANWPVEEFTVPKLSDL